MTEEVLSLGLKNFDNEVGIFDDALAEIDISKTFEIIGIEVPEDKKDEEFDAQIVMFEEFVSAAKSTSFQYINDILHKFINYTRKVPINEAQELYESGAAKYLYEIAISKNIELAILAFGVMLNITANSSPEYDPYNNDEFLDFMTSFFTNNVNDKILALALICLSNYSSNNIDNRNKCFERLSIPYLRELFEKTESIYVKEEVFRLIYSYSKFDINPAIAGDIIAFCIYIFQEKIDACYRCALWSLLLIIRNNEELVDEVYSDDLVEFIDNEITSFDDALTAGPALTLIGFFIYSGKQIQEINFRNITDCLYTPNDFVRTQSLYVQKHIIKSIPEFIPKLIKSRFISSIIDLLKGTAKYMTKLEAAHLYCSIITNGGTKVAERMCICGGVSELIVFLGYDDKDLTLHSIHALSELFRCANLIDQKLYMKMLGRLKSSNGFEAIDKLLQDEDIDIVTAADEFKTTYIDFDPDDILPESFPDDNE